MEMPLDSVDLHTLAAARHRVSSLPEVPRSPQELAAKTSGKPEVAKALSYFQYGTTEQSRMIPNSSIPMDFLKVHPSAFDYVVFARDYVQGIIHTEKPDKLREVTKQLDEYGRETYGAEWDDLINSLKKPRSGILKAFDRTAAMISQRRRKPFDHEHNKIDAKAYVQSMRFSKHGRISEQLMPGFFDGGRKSKFIGPFFIPSESNNREIIIVDPRIDSQLQTMILKAQGIKDKDIPDIDKLSEVVGLVIEEANLYGLSHDKLQKRIKTGQMLIDIPLGKFFKGKDNGVAGIQANCRHYAKMLHICAIEAGLESTLVKGNVRLPGHDKGFAHEWTEIQVGNQIYIGDLTELREEITNDGKGRSLPSNGVHPIVGGQIRTGEHLQNHSGNEYRQGTMVVYTVK